jgi:hypothetical protein
MLKKSIEFGLRFDDLERAHRRVEILLGLTLQEYEGNATGGTFYWIRMEDGTDLRLYQNWNWFDGEWNEPDYDEFPLLIRIQYTIETDSFEKKILSDPILRAKVIGRAEYDW